MSDNWLVTGPPRVGKSTVIERVVECIEAEGYTVGGLVSPEVRTDGSRTGFELVDLASGVRGTLADTEGTSGPRVGKYRVDVQTVDRLARDALSKARADADIAVIVEIAPMELHSDVFKSELYQTLDHTVAVLGAIHQRVHGEYGEIKARPDVTVVEVTHDNRALLPERIAGDLLERLTEENDATDT